MTTGLAFAVYATEQQFNVLCAWIGKEQGAEDVVKIVSIFVTRSVPS